MKLIVMILLAALAAASSITAATDTLKIRSYRIINSCSNEQRWLIDAYMGEVFSSDSLQSFDITIGYDTALIVPTDGLTSGTLSSQMPFGDISPFFNFRIPGEMRVGAFTIDRNVRGDQPLFAIAGTYKGACATDAFFTLPWEATFNEEFRSSVRVFQTDTIVSRAIPTTVDSIGWFIDQDVDTLPGVDSTRTCRIVRKNEAELAPGQPLKNAVGFLDGDAFQIYAISGVSNGSIQFNSDSTQCSWTDTTDGVDDTLEVVIRARSTDSIYTGQLVTNINKVDTCACIDPVGKDSTRVHGKQQPVVTVHEDFHESTGITTLVFDQHVEIQFLHGTPGQVQIFSLLGDMVWESATADQLVSVSTAHLPRGQYCLVARSDTHCKRMLFVK